LVHQRFNPDGLECLTSVAVAESTRAIDASPSARGVLAICALIIGEAATHRRRCDALARGGVMWMATASRESHLNAVHTHSPLLVERTYWVPS
jgi:hypothetical protein